MQVAALDADLIVCISAFWQTTCTAVRGGEEGFVIDSPVLPHELEALPHVLAQAGFPVSGLLATHGDWDHLLGRFAFPDASLGCGESTAARLRAEPGQAQRELRDFDDEHYVKRPVPLSLGAVQSLPVPGRLELGDGERELELHPAVGHTPDGAAYLIPWLGVLVCGDYLSPVEIPWISPGGSVDAYLATLERLRALVERVETVVPGHGGPLPRGEALPILEEDVTYLRALARRGTDAPLPDGRRSRAQRQIHDQNVAAVTS
jgi:glyoxylase-like metal-dependent hydrolase (beta-lactamase superfamily II)